MEEKEYLKINPVIVYPSCLLSGKQQDCFNCELYKNNKCFSPRGLCVKKYHNHRRGCLKYGEKEICPPKIPMYDQVFDMSKDIYLIDTPFRIGDHYRKRRELQPTWTEYEIKNSRHWQNGVISQHEAEIEKFYNIYGREYIAITPEALGVDVTATLKEVGIYLEWPPEEITHRISFAAIPLRDDFCFLNEENLTRKLKKR